MINFRGRGRGSASMNNFEDRLSDVEVNIDRGGRIVVVFRAERGRTHAFNGMVNGREGGRLPYNQDGTPWEVLLTLWRSSSIRCHTSPRP